MADRKIADDFVVGGISFQRFPQFQVPWFVVGQAPEEQNRRAYRPEFPEHDILLVWPGRFVLDVWKKELDGLMHVAAVVSGELPKIILRRGKNVTDGGHRVG